nr:uncharacterized protein LOC113705242 isoform X2 [Coffea arabica]
MPWTNPLPNILHSHPSLELGSDMKQKMIRQRVSSSMRPDFVQTLTEGMCFCQFIDKQNRHNFKVPRFVAQFVHSSKTPSITLRTGNKTITITMRGRQFTDNWNIFVAEHQLQFREVLVFVPESITTYTVLIYDRHGAEKHFPWYDSFYVYSTMGDAATWLYSIGFSNQRLV